MFNAISKGSLVRVRKELYWSAVVLIFSIGFYLRIRDLSLDYLFNHYLLMGAAQRDEGWQHAARVWAIFGDFLSQDWWHTHMVTPISNFVTYFSFELIGVGFSSLRLPASISGIIVVILLFFTCFRTFGPTTALMSLIFSSWNVFLIAYSRIAIIEPYLMAGQAILLWLAISWTYDRKRAFWVGFISAISFGIKASALLFVLPISILFVYLCWFQFPIQSTSRKFDWLSFKKWLIGGTLGSMLYGSFALLNWQKWYRLVLGFSANRTFITQSNRWENVLAFPTGSIDFLFLHLPLLTVLSFLTCVLVFRKIRWTSDSSQTQEEKPLVLRWFAELIPHHSIVQPQSQADILVFGTFILSLLIHLLIGADIAARRVSHLLIPMILVSSRGISFLWHPPETEVVIGSFGKRFCLWLEFFVLWFCVKSILFSFINVKEFNVPLFFSFPFSFSTLSDRTEFILSAKFEIFFIILFLCLSIIKGKHFASSLKLHCERVAKLLLSSPMGIVIGIVLIWVVHQSYLLYPVFADNRYINKEAGKRLDNLANGGLVLGNFSIPICWESRFYPLFYYPGIGIGYKRSTLDNLNNFILDKSIMFMIIPDPYGNFEKQGLFQWEDYCFFEGIIYQDFKKKFPTICDFQKVMYAYPNTDDLSHKSRVLVLQRALFPHNKHSAR